jgi:hypothetical protein
MVSAHPEVARGHTGKMMKVTEEILFTCIIYPLNAQRISA